MKRIVSLILLLALAANSVSAGISVVRSSGITLTGADGIQYVGMNGITLTGADGFLNYSSNGITLTGADGITLTGADGYTSTGANGATYTGSNGITLTGADGITLTGADGITLTGADGITLTGADGTQYTADSIVIKRPNGITLTGADGITLTGADGITLTGADGGTQTGSNGITLTGADGITLTGADGITLTGADGITLTGADGVTGIGTSGVLFDHTNPTGITLTGADGITLTGADGITLTGADGITLTGADGVTGLPVPAPNVGLQSLDPDLAMALHNASDDSNINAVIVYHNPVTDSDIEQLLQIGITGGTRMRVLPIVYVTATRQQLATASRLPSVRSLYGNRTLTFNSDPYFNATGIQRVAADSDLNNDNAGLPVTGRNVTVAVLDTGINANHADLAGRIVQNVRLTDVQSAPGFTYPAPLENLTNTDPLSGHGTFVGGVIAASGVSSSGRYGGVAPGAKLLGLSAGDANLMHVLSGFDYLLQKATQYNVRVVNCSFSATTDYNPEDPVNVATKMLTDRGINVVVSAGNTGPGNGTMNPYAVAPWVVSVGATDQNSRLASYSSRGSFGDDLRHPTLVAPGTDVVSLRAPGTATGVTGLGGADAQRLSASELPHYTTASGTSFSAPQVAGAIALMLEANPSLTPKDIKDILSRTATPLPKYFFHETGAGMLNTHAAVLEAAFPDRHMGVFRSTISRNGVRFKTRTSQTFQQMVFPNIAAAMNVVIPENTVQASVIVAWNLSANDFGLKVYSSSNTLLGESNYLNLPGLTGRREKVVFRNPLAQTVQSSVRHTGLIGTAQTILGAVEVTQIEYPFMTDLDTLSPELAAEAENSLMTSAMMPEGRKFRPSGAVTRAELAEALVRSGFVPQYVAASAMYTDVRDISSRGVVESAQSGMLVYDAPRGGRFYPMIVTSRLVAAVAFVKAAGLESQVSSATLPLTMTDTAAIPATLRGYVAVALQHGYLSLDGDKFNPSRSITRIELAKALNTMIGS